MGRNHQQGDDPLLIQIAEHFVQLQVDVPLFAHGVEISIQAVEINDFCAAVLDVVANPPGEFARGQLRRIDLDHRDHPFIDKLVEPELKPARPGKEDRETLVERVDSDVLAAPGRRDGKRQGEIRLARARWARQ